MWEDDCIEKPKNNQWKCLWVEITFQEINTTKAMSGVIIIRGIHINSFNAAIDNLSYQYTKTIISKKILTILYLLITCTR